MKKAVLLINLGTPDAPDKQSVKRYLTQFLNDPYVIDIPWYIRHFLVNRIIIPLRLNKSTQLYQRLWTEDGSPLAFYLERLKNKLQKELGDDYDIYTAMRYGKPKIVDAMKAINRNFYDELLVLPLYPQLASSTTWSSTNIVKNNQHLLTKIDRVMFIPQFYDDPGFINCFCDRISSYQPERFDHIIFSFHSLPISHLEKMHPDVTHKGCNCELEFPEHGKQCYKATSYETARLFAKKLNLKREDYTVSFQSRFAKRWVGPFTEDVITNLAREGKSRVLIVAPSFVADCLETLVEIGQDYKALFESKGGKELVMVESLNDHDTWVKALMKMM